MSDMPYRACFPLWEMGQIFPPLFPKAPSLWAGTCMVVQLHSIHVFCTAGSEVSPGIKGLSLGETNLFLTLI